MKSKKAHSTDKEIFVLTKGHLRLLRGMFIEWNDSHFLGAPAVDPKRPYGDGNIPNSIHFLLTGESIGTVGGFCEELSEQEEDVYIALHKQMHIALQIVLVTGKFEAGTYAKVDEYDALSWKKIC